jgi:hypothetical protein
MFKDWVKKILLKLLAEFLSEGDKPAKLSAAQKDKLNALTDKYF